MSFSSMRPGASPSSESPCLRGFLLFVTSSHTFLITDDLDSTDGDWLEMCKTVLYGNLCAVFRLITLELRVWGTRPPRQSAISMTPYRESITPPWPVSIGVDLDHLAKITLSGFSTEALTSSPTSLHTVLSRTKSLGQYLRNRDLCSTNGGCDSCINHLAFFYTEYLSLPTWFTQWCLCLSMALWTFPACSVLQSDPIFHILFFRFLQFWFSENTPSCSYIPFSDTTTVHLCCQFLFNWCVWLFVHSFIHIYTLFLKCRFRFPAKLIRRYGDPPLSQSVI